jgi:hypothetical protein
MALTAWETIFGDRGVLGGFVDHATCFGGTLRGGLDVVGDTANGSGRFFKRDGLLLGAPRDVLGIGATLIGSLAHLAGGLASSRNAFKRFHGGVEIDFAELQANRRSLGQPEAKVATRELARPRPSESMANCSRSLSAARSASRLRAACRF